MATGKRRRIRFPADLPARRAGDAWWAEIGGRDLRLSNLDKEYWPGEGITKGDRSATTTTSPSCSSPTCTTGR